MIWPGVALVATGGFVMTGSRGGSGGVVACRGPHPGARWVERFHGKHALVGSGDPQRSRIARMWAKLGLRIGGRSRLGKHGVGVDVLDVVVVFERVDELRERLRVGRRYLGGRDRQHVEARALDLDRADGRE